MQHHAYLFEGPLSNLVGLVEDARTRFTFTKQGDPDVRVVSEETFGIGEARALRQAAGLRSATGRALFVVGVSTMTIEAQQALLKLFEEPQQGTIFVLLTPHGTVIPTLRSRMTPYPNDGLRKSIIVEHALARKFLASSQTARSAEIAKMLKPARPDDSGRSVGDDEGLRESVRAFLDALEVEMYPHLAKGNSRVREGLEDIAKIRGYANDRAPSYKMLLEHLAATLPQLQASGAKKEG
ncbi:hypothetical protein HYS79_01290 [Patescibacteria group bacterium]|nr:hypothetical protein [Patescibacteria group bacterium]